MVMRSFDDKPPRITAGTIPKLLDKLADETVQGNLEKRSRKRTELIDMHQKTIPSMLMHACWVTHYL